ncbi:MULTISPECIES: flagellar basal body rod protein FlgB [Pseudoalteromonas]|jgi:flagellar basal-body rod protein FlgB|uniref:flagellar basal body rod protein FlgB n=1 Tax=Pseudoalteromonas TaxID=53246 RepID=UPI000781FBD1|nr:MULTISPECIES: flagellar basal body rod protein FlgB [Gammaproteobacteria]MCF7500723.1 flagellar basal body rod protein FlgB [Pseudoalteromonas sp. L1]RZF92247.1 flagellar basal body rod protein FlgB [Pseudoalteromonas sp. CO302Y]RZG08482.1 flagellar basal body rod protein FlgB [Pseudoalteromonas sp. CO133X]UJX26342.1 flagellar basal body rod protein FlgB [Pseudoalteromonas sp. CF6-2]WOC27136.1 flagellar basal body rod protein FlgB [Pseudoalteromonas sp. N1230-9]|tara:strand:+ start:651 stop:1022 length:372 start_codon:yes stop_codon:yes gene_type:complete
MALFDKALGVHPFAMQLRIDRAEVIASNLANVDTPNFKARDVDYQQILGDVAASMEHNNDVGFAGITANELMYRVPYQASSDGNTVELNVEQAKFSNNSMDFQTSMTFLNMKISGLHKVIKGN